MAEVLPDKAGRRTRTAAEGRVDVPYLSVPPGNKLSLLQLTHLELYSSTFYCRKLITHSPVCVDPDLRPGIVPIDSYE